MVIVYTGWMVYDLISKNTGLSGLGIDVIFGIVGTALFVWN